MASSSSQKLIEKSLSKIVDLLKDYDELCSVIIKQKPGQTTDYGPILDSLDEVVYQTEYLRWQLFDKKLVIDNFDELLVALIESAKYFTATVEGLSAKANRSGSYSMLKYFNDMKKHKLLRKELDNRRTILSASFIDDDNVDEDKSVVALVLSPKSEKVLEENITITQSTYSEYGDGRGHVFVSRVYRDGYPEDFLVPKDVWDGLKDVFSATY